MPEEIHCEIHIQEVLDQKWAAYFAPMELSFQNDGTTLVGLIHDKAELFGILLKIRDLGLTLVSLAPAEQ